MSNLFTSSAPIPLSLNLEDGDTAKYPRATIYSNGSLVGTVDLGHIGQGRYSGTWIPGALAGYDALFLVFDDAGHSVESDRYGRVMERWQNDALITTAVEGSTVAGDTADAVWDELLAGHAIGGSSGEFLARLTAARAGNIDDTNVRVRLVEKILRNRLSLEDGDTANWVLYDDDSVTPLLTWSVSDKEGSAIAQQRLVPSRRTRGA